jgi:hypothetical protein
VLPKWDDYVRHGSAMVCAASGRLVFPTPGRQSRLHRQHLENPTVFIIALLVRSLVTATTRAYRRYVGSCIVAFIFFAYRYSIEMEGATRERQRLCSQTSYLKPVLGYSCDILNGSIVYLTTTPRLCTPTSSRSPEIKEIMLSLIRF